MTLTKTELTHILKNAGECKECETRQIPFEKDEYCPDCLVPIISVGEVCSKCYGTKKQIDETPINKKKSLSVCYVCKGKGRIFKKEGHVEEVPVECNHPHVGSACSKKLTLVKVTQKMAHAQKELWSVG